MRLHGAENQIERSGIQGEQAFGIMLNRKMYEMLSDKLYMDKVGAVVRELCCNAWDTHKAAGNPNPFHVTLPTQLEQNFIVKDFGTGLPNDQLVKLYSTLGLSTKENSNDQIGALGLGSKSPFAVTETFTIESNYNGMKSFFMCFKNEQGYPSILPTASDIPTYEPNGITITVPVAVGHYDSYKRAIEKQLAFMQPKPKIVNVEDFEFVEPEKGFENEYGFVLNNSDSFHLQSRHYALMGNVLYPIESQQISNEARNKLQMLNGVKVIYFGIGDLDIQPSREGLSYDELTIKCLNEKCDAYVNKAMEVVDAEIKSFTDPLQAYARMKEIDATMFRGYTDHHEVIVAGYKINSRSHIDMPKFEAKRQRVLERDSSFKTTKTEDYTVPITTFVTQNMDYNRWNDTLKFNIEKSSFHEIRFSALLAMREGKLKVIIRDKEDVTNIKRKMKQVIKEDLDVNVWCLGFNDEYPNKDWNELVNILKPFDAEKAIIKLSEIQLPKVERQPKQAGVVNIEGITSYNGKTAKGKAVFGLDDIGKGGFYVLTNRNKPEDYPNKNTGDFMAYVEETAYDQPLYFVGRSGLDFLKHLQAAGAVEFKEHIKKEMTGYQPGDDIIGYCNNEKVKSVFGQSVAGRYDTIRRYLQTNKKHIPKLIKLVSDAYMAEYSTFQGLDNVVYTLRKEGLMDLFAGEAWHNMITKGRDYKEQLAEFLKRYPMMKMVHDRYLSDGDAKLYSDYLEMMDMYYNNPLLQLELEKEAA